MERRIGKFIWDLDKENANIAKHGIDFTTAVSAFQDVNRKVFTDSKHSAKEPRYVLYWESRQQNYNSPLYISRKIHPHIRSRILEKGKGIL